MATVRELRKAKKMSQTKLAELAHIGRTTLYRIEKGKDANEATIYAIAQVLGVEPQEISGVTIGNKARKGK